jgi:hypothetical protein
MLKNKGGISPMPFGWLNRRMRLAWLFFLCFMFAVTTPITILYTIGYRYNISEGIFHESGVLSIDVLPKTAQVSINGIPVHRPLPLRLTNLSPGRYHVTIQSSGYHTWSTEVFVGAKQTTYIKSVGLFRELLPEIVQEDFSAPKQFTPSFDGSYALFTKENDGGTAVYLWDSATRTTGSLYRSTHTADSIHMSWAPFSLSGYIADRGTTSTLLSLIFDTDIVASYTIPTTHTLPEWIHDEDGDILSFPLTDTAVGIFQQGTIRTTNLRVPKNTAWFMDTKEDIWFWYTTGTSITKVDTESIRFAFSAPHMQIRIADPKRVLFTDTDGLQSVFTHAQDKTFYPALKNIHGSFLWNAFTNEWIFVTPQEIIALYPDGTDALLLRSSHAYEAAHPLDEYGVLLLQKSDRLTAFNPGYYTTQDLFTLGQIDRAFTYPKERTIFFFGTVGNTEGLFSLGY